MTKKEKQERNIIIFISSSLKRYITPACVESIFSKNKIYEKIDSISNVDVKIYELKLYEKIIKDYIYIQYNYYGATISSSYDLKNESIQLINALSYTYFENGQELEYYPELRNKKSVI